MSEINQVPYVCMYDQLSSAMSSLQVQGMKAVEHEDDEPNNDFAVDPMADPRLDKMDLFNMVDSDVRDQVLNSRPDFSVGDLPVDNPVSTADSSSESGSGE